MGSWIHDGFLDSRWVPGFTIDFWHHDGFLVGFTMDSWIRDGFLDSRWIFGSPTRLTGVFKAVFVSSDK